MRSLNFCWFTLLLTLAFVPLKASAAEVQSEKRTAAAAEERVTETPEKGSSVKAAPFCGSELQRQVQDALRRWKKVSDSQAEGAAHEFLGLYQALNADSELGDSVRKNLTRSVRRKLVQLSRQIEASIEIPDENAEPSQASLPETTPPPASVKSAKRKSVPMAQAAGGGAGAMGGGAFGGIAGGTGNSQSVQESGEKLVELIQETIHPDSWETNGGNGAIQFWLPGGNLIIRQTDANHEEIQNLLDQLRRAGS